MGLCSLKKHSYSPSKSRVCCFRLKSKSQAKLARSISTLNNINCVDYNSPKVHQCKFKSYAKESSYFTSKATLAANCQRSARDFPGMRNMEWVTDVAENIFIIHKTHTFKQNFHNFKCRYDKTFLNLSNSVAAEAQLTARTCRKYSSSCQICWVLTLEILPILLAI